MVGGVSASFDVRNRGKLGNNKVPFDGAVGASNAFQSFSMPTNIQYPVGGQQVANAVASTSVIAASAPSVMPTPAQIAPQPAKDSFSAQNAPMDKSTKAVIGAVGLSSVISVAAAVLSVKNIKALEKLPSKAELPNVDALMKPLKEQVENLQKNIKTLEDAATSNSRAVKKNGIITQGVLGVLGGIGLTEAFDKAHEKAKSVNTATLTDDDQAEITSAKDSALSASEKINNAANTANEAISRSSGRQDLHLFTEPYHGLNLLTKTDLKFRNTKDYEAAIKKVQDSADAKIAGGKTDNDLTPGSTVWSITSEFDPIKEGGLGVVPVHVRRNLTDKLGMDFPTFMPMYLNNGKFTLKESRGADGKTNYTYRYGEKPDQFYNLDKVVSLKVNAYKNGKQTPETVDVFSYTDPKDGAKLYFLKNDDYFSSSVYGNNAKAQEKEKFAFFSRASYELAKYKLDPTSEKDVKVYDQAALDALKAPDGMFLNDWQAAPVAAMARYSSSLEQAHGELSKDAANKLYDMKIITVGHNAEYQGQVWEKPVAENMLNTLFDDYASDIVKNGKVTLNKPDSNEVDKNLEHVTLLGTESNEENVGLLNMGIALSDYFCPVSPNYANELVTDPVKSGWLRTIINARKDSDTLRGVLNGNDRDNIDIHEGSGLFKNAIQQPVYKKGEGGKQVLDHMKYPDFVPYSHLTSKEDVIAARKNNRNVFVNQILPDSLNGNLKGFEVIEESYASPAAKRVSKMPQIDENTPIFFFGGRAVSQKGLDILSESIKTTLKDWNKQHPGQPKPVFILGSSDGGEGPAMKSMLGNLKKGLKGDDYDRVMIFYGAWGGFKAAQGSTDFGVLPSWFEPCGLVQTEIQAMGGIPVTTNTGGFPNTIYDPQVDKENVNKHAGQTGYIADVHYSDRSKLKENADEFSKLINRCANDFFKDKSKLEDISYNALQLDHSWIRPDSEGKIGGPAFEYLKLFGMKDEDVKKAYEDTVNKKAS